MRRVHPYRFVPQTSDPGRSRRPDRIAAPDLPLRSRFFAAPGAAHIPVRAGSVTALLAALLRLIIRLAGAGTQSPACGEMGQFERLCRVESGFADTVSSSARALPAGAASGWCSPGSTAGCPAGGALVLTGQQRQRQIEPAAALRDAAGAGRRPPLWGGAPVARDIAGYRAAIHYVGHLDATKPALTPRETLGFWAALRGIVGARHRGGAGRLRARRGCRLAVPLAVGRTAPAPRAGPPDRRPGADLAARRADRGARRRWRGAPRAPRSPSTARAGGRVAVATHQPIALDRCHDHRARRFCRRRPSTALASMAMMVMAALSRPVSARPAAVAAARRRVRARPRVFCAGGAAVPVRRRAGAGTARPDRRRDHLGGGAARCGAEPRPAVRRRPRRWRARSDRAVAGAARTRGARQGRGALGDDRLAADA